MQKTIIMQHMRVLLVEDDVETQRMIVTVLKRLDSDIDIDVATNGNDALARYLEHCHDLVITDNAHSGMFGIELIGLLLTTNPLQPVILQTGNYGEQIETFKEKYRDVPLLEKPYTQKQLQDIVGTVLNQWHQRKDSASTED